MSAKGEAQEWAETVRRYGERHELTYEPVGGINPKDGPVALCVGGSNRLTGQLAEGFWGSCCDADEKEVGGFFSKAVLPTALLAKAHMPDLAKVVPAFNVESIEGHEHVTQRFARKGDTRITLAPTAPARELAPGFDVTDAMVAEFRALVEKSKVKIDASDWQKDLPFIKAMIRFRIDEAAFGIAEARRRMVEVDPQAQAALNAASCSVQTEAPPKAEKPRGKR